MDRRYNQTQYPFYPDAGAPQPTYHSTNHNPRLHPRARPRARTPSPPPPSEPESISTMSSWFSRATSSNQAQFAATAIVSGVVVAGAILGYQHVRRQERVEDLKSSIPEVGGGHKTNKVCWSFLLCTQIRKDWKVL